MDFDSRPRLGTQSTKWDQMEARYGVSPEDGLAMWIADMDFPAPPCVIEALRADLDQGVLGYFGDDGRYLDAVCGWMKRRHGWEVDPEAIFVDHGTVQGASMVLEAFTEPGDHVLMLTPIYMGLRRIAHVNGRPATEVPLAKEDGRYVIDFDAMEAALTGKEKLIFFCSPLNPGGRVWTQEELTAIADFCIRHDLLLVSDEVHHDLIMPGYTHIAMPVAAPQARDRTIMLTGTGKTFNLAGGMLGNVTIESPELRARFKKIHARNVTDVNRFGPIAATAAYNEGEAWLEAVIAKIDQNRKIFDAGINAIPGVHSMDLQSTYLAWVDFTNTGMDRDQIHKRVKESAKIAANDGLTLADHCGSFLRFNLAASTDLVEDAVARMQTAFSDLQ
ncbi:MalY/PatB family protein [Paracoccaceae bacterium GXU_MW_L88]